MELTTKIRVTRDGKKRLERLKNEGETDSILMDRIISLVESYPSPIETIKKEEEQ